MNKFEFSDFYKFMVSAGLVLMTLSFVVPWLFLQVKVDLLAYKPDPTVPTPSLMQTILEQRLKVLELISFHMLWLFFIPLLFGIALLVFGLLRWRWKQRIVDLNDLAILGKNIDGLTNNSTKNVLAKLFRKFDDDIEEAFFNANPPEKQTEEEDTVSVMAPAKVQGKAVSSKQVLQFLPSETAQHLQKYLALEERITKQLEDRFQKTHVAYSNTRLGGVAEYDLILQAKSPKRHVDEIVEFLYKKKLTYLRFRELVGKFHSACKAYALLTKREVRGTLWFVTGPEKVEEMKQFVRQIQGEIEAQDMRIFVVSEDMNDLKTTLTQLIG